MARPERALTTNINWSTAAPYALPYYCRVSSSGATNTAVSCNLSLSPSVVSSVQLPPANIGGNSVNFLFNYGKVGSLTYSWGELHSLEMCTGTTPSNCQAQWTEQYIYKFDTEASLPTSPATDRPPGTATNPIASKTLTYYESLLGSSTQLQETTNYTTTAAPTNLYTYPTVSSGPSIVASQITYPDGSYSEIFTANLCPANLKSRDLCVAVPYKILNRDGSTTEMQWVSNAPAPGIPSLSLFNPYVQATVNTPPGAGVVQIKSAQQDQNGNTTSIGEYDWAPSSAVVRDTNTGLITSVCGPGCTVVRQTTNVYNGNGMAYWIHSAPAYLRAPQSVTLSNGITNCITTACTTNTFTYDHPLTTANLVQLEQKDSVTGGTVTTLWSYLSNGNLLSTTDQNGNVTQVTYGCSASNNLYPSTVTVASLLHTSYNYTGANDCTSGFPSSVTDTDNSIQTAYTYDNIGRRTHLDQKNTATGLDRTTDVTYDDVNLVVTTKQDDRPGVRLVNTINYDAMGRVQSTTDGLGRQIVHAYRYGTGGTSYELTSNPFASTGDSTMGWTLTTTTLATPIGGTPNAIVLRDMPARLLQACGAAVQTQRAPSRQPPM